jgi:cytosine/adenosine deaminase-related metal-dependent hydrolase
MKASSSDLILTNGAVIDGTGNPPIDHASVVIRNGTIQSVGTQRPPAPDAPMIDVEGRTILPGFFNTHVHRAFKADVLRA